MEGHNNMDKRYNVSQIHELEAVFKDNPLSNAKELVELGTELTTDSKHVNFWLQNKKNQVKLQLERHENKMLKQDNDKLRMENIALKEAMRNPKCDQCGNQSIFRDIDDDEHQINIEDVASQMRLNFKNDLSNPLPVISPRPTISFANEDITYDESMLMHLAFGAMNELLRMADIGEPLWVKSLDGGGEILNLDEYAKLFTPLIGIRPGHFTTEATRASSIVTNNSLTLMETLMDKNRWVEIFSCIIGKTSIVDVISTSIGGSRSNTLLLIKTELQIISDLVPVREIKFLRYCKQHAKGIWAIVDVSIDTIKEGSQHYEVCNCRKLPSGCIVQDMPNGYSKVTWIEHMEYNENFIHHLYRPLVKTGLGFGAQRWIATLQRQSGFLDPMISFVDPTNIHTVSSSVRMMAQRMSHSFYAGVCATTHEWEIIQLANEEDPKLMMRKNIGNPIGVVLSATKTIWLPVKQQCLFEFFMNEQTRSQWDVLSNSDSMQQIVHIFKGQNINSSISLFRANGNDTGSNKNNMLILKDTCTDTTGSLLIYARINSLEMDVVLNGGDSSCVTLLPYGIAIVPDCFQDFSVANNYSRISGENDNGFCIGSLVTIGFQILMNNSSFTTLSMESADRANDLISHTVHAIKTAFKCK